MWFGLVLVSFQRPVHSRKELGMYEKFKGEPNMLNVEFLLWNSEVCNGLATWKWV